VLRRFLARVGGAGCRLPGFFFGSLLSFSAPDAGSNIKKEPAAHSHVRKASFSLSRSRGSAANRV